MTSAAPQRWRPLLQLVAPPVAGRRIVASSISFGDTVAPSIMSGGPTGLDGRGGTCALFRWAFGGVRVRLADPARVTGSSQWGGMAETADTGGDRSVAA